MSTTTWTRSRLLDGDELGSYPGHRVPAVRSLAALYAARLGPPVGATQEEREQAHARVIVTRNGYPFTPAGVEKMLVNAGSRTVIGGAHVIDSRTVLELPVGGPRQPAGATPVTTSPSASNGWLVAGLFGLGGWWLFRKRKRR
jgi:hypothetical protein